MNKEEALQWFMEVQGNQLSDRERESIKKLAKEREDLWDDAAFFSGTEYGVLWAIWKIFNLTQEDLIAYCEGKKNEID